MRKDSNVRQIISLLVIFAFLGNYGVLPPAQAQEFLLPEPGQMISLSPQFNPPILKGIKVHLDNPFKFEFILDQGGDSPSLVQRGGQGELKQEASRLIKYFLAALTIPEKDLWVNLSPYEKNRIVPESFGQTEMGRDLLAEDYILKQITASLIYPEGATGKKFWNRVYEEASKRFGTTNTPINTFNKVWIVPEKAIVYENAKAGTAYIVESKLKVMLEEDYLSLKEHGGINRHKTNQIGSEVVRQIVLPELNKEVNEDKNFSQLRQVYNSLILATWYKKKIKDSILSQVYEDKNKIAGVNINDPQEKQKIYERYLQAFKKGAYNYIKEEIDPLTKQPMAKKYFSGGVQLDFAMNATNLKTPLLFIHNDALIKDLGASSKDIQLTVEINGYDQAMHSQEPVKPRTFMEFVVNTFGRDVDHLAETERYMSWPLYATELERTFFTSGNFYESYKDLFDDYLKHAVQERIEPRQVKSYIPIVKRPFSTVQEIKDIVNIDTEWSIDYLPEPGDWKGPRQYNFILSVPNDGQLHMSFYDGQGLIREFKNDQETEAALRTIGIIGEARGLVVLVRSALEDQFKENAILGVAHRLGLSGHSHPKGSSVVPSQTNRLGSPADVELFYFKFMGLPKDFPIDQEIPAIAQREKSSEKEAESEPTPIPYQEVPAALDTYIQRLEQFASDHQRQKGSLPIDELALYLKAMRAMYKETIGKWEGSKADHHYVHEDRTELAGELGFHPAFFAAARKMLQDSYDGAYRVLAEQYPGSFVDSTSSLEDMVSIMRRLVRESAIHPELRQMAISIINDPTTYGLDEIDLSKSNFTESLASLESRVPQAVAKPVKGLVGFVKKQAMRLIGSAPENQSTGTSIAVKKESASLSVVDIKAGEFAAISDGLVAAAEKERTKKTQNKLRPTPEEVVRDRSSRLLMLTEASVNDDPVLAEASLREYLRLLTVFPKIDFYVAVTLTFDKYRNIMTSSVLRPTLIEIARSIPDSEDSLNTLTVIAGQLIRENDLQGALDLLEETKYAAYYEFSGVLQQLINLLLVTQELSEKMVGQLERIIENIPENHRNSGETKVELLVALGKKYDELGQKAKAHGYYSEAWKISGRVAVPAMTRLHYLVPLMREKGIKFPQSREEVLEQVRRLAESDLQKSHRGEDARKMIKLAREYAFNRDYAKAEEAAQYINDHMQYPRDHYDNVYGGIMEAATLYGDDQIAIHTSQKMTNYKHDHWNRAAQLLVDKGDFEKALLICRFGTLWGEGRVLRGILDKDNTRIELVRGYLQQAITHGFDHFSLDSMVDLIADYPDLDPDGQLILQIFNAAFEHNSSIFAKDSHRIILNNLRRIILAKARRVDPQLSGMSAVFREAVKQLPSPQENGNKAQIASVDTGGIDLTANRKYLEIQNSGETIKFDINQAQLVQLQNVRGFVPVIINIQPMTNLRAFLGLDNQKLFQ